MIILKNIYIYIYKKKRKRVNQIQSARSNLSVPTLSDYQIPVYDRRVKSHVKAVGRANPVPDIYHSSTIPTTIGWEP